MKVILGALAVSAILVSSALARDNDDNGNHYGWYKDDHGWHRYEGNRTGNRYGSDKDDGNRNGNHYGWYKDQGNANNGGSSGGHYHAAPGPIAGAGLPVLAIGYGVYWLVKRRRKTLR